MNGFKALVRQDLPHVLPSKGLQLSSSCLHTTASTRRFWSFFEFSPKEEICRESRKCAVPKDIVSSSLTSPSEFEDASKASANLAPHPEINPMLTLNPKVYAYQFDLKSPINCLKIPKPLKEDNLMSLLDGNPVPRTLKWKLKGYKTLRNEQAGDFAFVPGGKSHDFDILSRKDCGEAVSLTNAAAKTLREAKSGPKALENAGNIDKKDTLSLTVKAIENKSHVGATTKSGILQVNAAESAKLKKAEAVKTEASSSPQGQSVAKTEAAIPNQKVTSANKVSATPVAKKDIKYLPVSKSDFSANQMKCQTQQSAQYSSRPPKGISKPMPPVLRQHAEKLADTKKLSPSMETYRHKKLPPSWSSKSQREVPTPAEAAEEAASEYSTTEHQFEAKEAAGIREEAAKRDVAQYPKTAEKKSVQEHTEYKPEEHVQNVDMEGPRISSRKHKGYRENPRSTQFSSEAGKAEPKVDSSEYFAPKSWSNSEPGASRQPSRFVKSTPETLHSTYESIGISSKATTLKISNSYDKQQKSSPCAATQARLQQNDGASQGQQIGSFGFNGSSMSSSGGGSRKPPSTPPFTRRASTDSSSPLKKLQPGGIQSSRRPVNSRSSNISTSSAYRAPKKCKDGDDRTTEGKTICTKPRQNSCSRRRSCDRQDSCQERPKCQERRESKVKKKCKRYCCPMLQTPTDCDYNNFQCPKQRQRSECGGRRPEKQKKTKHVVDPTCMPNEEESGQRSCGREGGREICTDPSRRRSDCSRRTRQCDRQERSCNRERSSNRERSCNREQSSCRTRERSCQRQERRDCSRSDQGREICTKPRRRDSCSRRRSDDRDCGKRSAKCTGRRNYTQLAYMRRPNASKNMKRFSSLPVVGFTLFSMGSQGNEPKQNLFVCPSKFRFYGKKSKPPSCKPSEADSRQSETSCKSTKSSCKSAESSCKSSKSSCKNAKPPPCKFSRSSGKSAESEKRSSKCKKPPAKCLDRRPSESKCQPRKSESRACGKSESRKETSCKAHSKSEDVCGKRREQLCSGKSTGGKSGEVESMKQRQERERKEMQECMKDISKSKEKKEKKNAAPSGLERVTSPCKQRQTKKKKDSGDYSSSKTSCIGTPLNCLFNTESAAFMRQENKPFSELMDRPYSTVRISHSDELGAKESSDNQWRNFWNFTGDDAPGLEAELPLPVVVENPEGVEDNQYRDNWFLPWFNGSNP